jgi:hypothetical protein
MPLTDPWLPDPVPLVFDGVSVRTYRYAPIAGTMTELENLQCLSVRQSEGTDPGSAVFRYDFSSTDPDAPTSFEQALSDSIDLFKAVQPGERLVVKAFRPDDEWEYLFDGEALDFQLDLDADTEVVPIVAPTRRPDAAGQRAGRR